MRESASLAGFEICWSLVTPHGFTRYDLRRRRYEGSSHIAPQYMDRLLGRGSDCNHCHVGRFRFLHRVATVRSRRADLRRVPSSHHRAGRVSAADGLPADQSHAVGSALSTAPPSAPVANAIDYRVFADGTNWQLSVRSSVRGKPELFVQRLSRDFTAEEHRQSVTAFHGWLVFRQP